MIDDPRLLVQGILDYQNEVGRRTYTENELQQMPVHSLKRLADVCEVDTRLQKEDYARTLVDWVSGQSSCITQIACGHYHFAAVTDQPSFNLYTWGQNQNGQLGHGDVITRRKPTRVMSMKKGVREVTCGAEFTMCVKHDGFAVTFGANTSMQLGVGAANAVQADAGNGAGGKKKKKKKDKKKKEASAVDWGKAGPPVDEPRVLEPAAVKAYENLAEARYVSRR